MRQVTLRELRIELQGIGDALIDGRSWDQLAQFVGALQDVVDSLETSAWYEQLREEDERLQE